MHEWYIYIYVIAYIKYTSVFAQFLTNRVCHLPWLKWMEPMVGPNSWGSELPGMASSLYQVPARKADVNEASCTVTVLAVYNCGTTLRHCYISLYIGIYTVYRCIYIYIHTLKLAIVLGKLMINRRIVEYLHGHPSGFFRGNLVEGMAGSFNFQLT